MTEEQIKKSRILSPGLVDGFVMTFLAATNNCFYMKQANQDSWQKDAAGKWLTIPLASVLIARQEYLNLHLEEEMNKAIELEITKLGGELVKKAAEIIDFITRQEGWVSESKSTGQQVVEALFEQNNPAVGTRQKNVAQEFFAENPTALVVRDTLKEYCQTLNYEALYQALNQNQEPLAVFSHNSPAMKRVFGRLALDDTINDLQERGPLYVKAKVNVEKRYFP